MFAGIDLVMHAGDVYVNRVLDELSAIAPVIAALGNGDEGLDGHRYRLDRPTSGCARRIWSRSRACESGWCMRFRRRTKRRTKCSRARWITQFGGPVDVVVQGHSHVEGVTRFGATLVINPGSATLPRNLVGVPGTVAILEIGNGGEVSAEIISLA